MKEKTVENAFNEFIQDKKSMNYSTSHIKHLIKAYSLLCEVYNKKDLCSGIDLDIRMKFIQKIKENNPKIKMISIASYVKDLRTILYYFMDMNYMERFKIQLPKVKKEYKEIYTFGELGKLLERPIANMNKNNNLEEYRNWVLINYFLSTGNRPKSVSNIKIGDVYLKEKYLVLRHTKNGKEQIVHLEDKLCEILKEYMEKRGGFYNDYLFCSKYNEKLEPQGMWKAINRYNIYRGVHKEKSIYLFRHTYATLYMIYSKGSIYRLSKKLGHSDIKITENYISELKMVEIMTYKGEPREDILKLCYEKVKEEKKTTKENAIEIRKKVLNQQIEDIKPQRIRLKFTA